MHGNLISTGKGLFNLTEAEFAIKLFLLEKNPGELLSDLQEILLFLNEQRFKKAYPNYDLKKLSETISSLDRVVRKCYVV